LVVAVVLTWDIAKKRDTTGYELEDLG